VKNSLHVGAAVRDDEQRRELKHGGEEPQAADVAKGG